MAGDKDEKPDAKELPAKAGATTAKHPPPAATAPLTAQPLATAKSDYWQTHITQLQAFQSKYGTTNVPPKSKDYPDLADWVELIKKRKHTLTEEQRNQLDALGFDWTITPAKRLSKVRGQGAGTLDWADMFQALKDYKRKHGNCLVPQKSTQHPELAIWVKNQRSYHRQGKLDEDRIAQLEQLGFVWNVSELSKKGFSPKYEKLWHDRYQELVDFVEDYGHCFVPAKYIDNQPLADWVNNQRTMFVTGLIREDRKQVLDDLGFSWDGKEPTKVEQEEAAKTSNQHIASPEDDSSIPNHKESGDKNEEQDEEEVPWNAI